MIFTTEGLEDICYYLRVNRFVDEINISGGKVKYIDGISKELIIIDYHELLNFVIRFNCHTITPAE